MGVKLKDGQRFLFSYPKEFDRGDIEQIIRILTDYEDAPKIWRMVYPKYYIQVTFCDNGDIILRINTRGKRAEVIYLTCFTWHKD